MKYTAIAFALFSAIGASASASSGTADDRDVIIRNLMNKVDILSSKVEAQDAWRTELVSSLKHVKAGIAPQDKTSVRRNLRQEDDAAVEPVHDFKDVLGEILYEVVAKVEKIEEAIEDVHECLDYDHTTDSCLLGDGSSISSVAIRGGTIHLESTATGHPSGIGLTSATRIDIDAGTNVEITADNDKGDVFNGFAYIGTNKDGDFNQEGAGFKAINDDTFGDSAQIKTAGRIDIDAATNVEITADTGFAYIGTNKNGNIGSAGQNAGFKASQNQVILYADNRIDIDIPTAGNVEVACGVTEKNLCTI